MADSACAWLARSSILAATRATRVSANQFSGRRSRISAISVRPASASIGASP